MESESDFGSGVRVQVFQCRSPTKKQGFRIPDHNYHNEHTKYYWTSPPMRRLCFTWCLSVYMLGTARINYWKLLPRNSAKDLSLAKFNGIFFVQSSATGSGPANLRRIFQHCETGILPQFGSYLRKIHRIFAKILQLSLDHEVPI